ncbi:MAG TPA: MBL fold metallo-hydrolase [Steroidobacteraceae bacterium]|nr:MBL fold metallo-hydrolase [Steroidobacteraceae bacterium]
MSNDLTPGRWVRIAPDAQRLVAPNASLMTGPGTNSYAIGDPPVAILDPGPNDSGHLNLLREAVPRPQFIFVTHTHRDHSSGARTLAAMTGAPIVGLPPPQDGRQDETCAPDIQPANDQVFTLGLTAGASRLRAIHTPGHASNHVCFLIEGSLLLFSGDHVLDGVTPVILPPDGDMAAYLDSLERLKAYAPRAIAPGHGRVLPNPLATIDGVIAHRAKREAKVLGVLEAMGRGTLDELLPKVYSDVRPELLRVARLSLEAHLIKLVREGRAQRAGDLWVAQGK